MSLHFPQLSKRFWLILGAAVALTVVTVDIVIVPAVHGTPLVHLLFQGFSDARDKYGVNPWSYGFLWVIVSAFPYWGGFHLFIIGLERSDTVLRWEGIALNRFGVALAPVYVILWGHNLPIGVVMLTQIVIPIAFSAFFFYRLRDEKWREKQNGFTNKLIRGWHNLLLVPLALLYRLPPIVKMTRHEVAKGSEFQVRVATTQQDLAAVYELEELVFLQEKYPYNYRQFDGQSVVIGAWLNGQIVGALRLIGGVPLLPPFLTDCKVWGEKWEELARKSVLEELGTVVVHPDFRGRFIAARLYREAYASSCSRGITHWGIIMEPARVRKLNSLLSINFSQVGPLGYHGWDCAGFTEEIARMNRMMSWVNPTLYAWFMEVQKASPIRVGLQSANKPK